jgi:hypothetical protein
MRSLLLCSLALAAGISALRAQEEASIPTADGFQCPVGPNGTGEGYYIARGYRPNGHLGDDWNGTKGGDTDLGDPVYATAVGIVTFAKNYHVGWGNVVIIRHAFYEGMTLKYADSLYGHLNDFNVREGQEVKRGQLIGHIGNNFGMYDAHLHFEIRKNIGIGMYRSSFPRDDSNYYEPNKFLASHETCPHGGKTVQVPINNYPATPPPLYVAAKVDTPIYSPGSAPASHLPPPGIGGLRLSHDYSAETRTPPVPAPPPAPRIVTASTPAPTPKIVVAPDPTPKPPVAASRTTAETASSAKAGATPAPKTTAAASTKTGTSATASTKGTGATSAKASLAPSAGKTATTASAKTPATPAPTKSTASAKSTPAPSSKTAATGSAASKATPAPVVALKSPASPQGLPEVASKPDPKPKPSSLEADTSEPAAPVPSPNNGAIRRSSQGFHVDRFPDLRGSGGY